MDPTCQFCGLVDKTRCKTKAQADDCKHAPVEGRSPVIASGPFEGMKRLHYGAILADPPWTFETRSDEGKGRSPEQHYQCMNLDDIKALPVQDVAAKNCVLFLWIIDTHLPMALEVIEAWGFTYKTKAFNWIKLNAGGGDMPAADPKTFFTGMGFWTRANPEDVLLATKGKPKRNEGGGGVRRLIVAERREHSRKPDDIFGRIEALVPGPYLELFSREKRLGWDCWGNEVGKFNAQPAYDPEIEDLI